MKKKIWVIVALTLLVIGCAPLQQAPLVYASKIAVGIDLSATSTESPGVSMSVGYKQVDAAYVPVAVAKKCEDKAPASSCVDPIYRLLPIQGNFGSNGTSVSGPNEEEAKEALRKYNVEADKLKALTEAAEAARRRVEVLQSRQLQLQTRSESVKARETEYQELVDKIQLLQPKDAAAPEPADQIKLNDARLKKEAIDKQRLQPAEISELNGLPDAITAATTEYKNASTAVNATASEVEKLKPKAAEAKATLANVVDKRDAFSVYGRFESSTRTKNDTKGISAGIDLGKVFSTGVASQNLSSGLAEYYRQIGLAACYDTVVNLAKTISDAAVIKQMLTACAAQASK